MNFKYLLTGAVILFSLVLSGCAYDYHGRPYDYGGFYHYDHDFDRHRGRGFDRRHRRDFDRRHGHDDNDRYDERYKYKYRDW
jgi:hypothetical protein